MLHAIASAFVGVATFISSLFGVAPAAPQYYAVEDTRSLGASLPSGTAVFETSLQSRISSTDTSMTLVANSVRGGSALSGFQCFTVDEGRTDAEFICGTIAGTAVSSMMRGVDPATGTTSNSALKFAHRVGANVKITDFPLLQILRNQANGSDTYPHALKYDAGVTPASTGDLTDKEYVDALAFSGAGVIDATSIAKGVSELAGGCEAASSTAAGGSGPLVIPAGLASSTRTSAALSACKVVVANNSGVIDDNYLSTSTLFATSSISGGPVGNVAKNAQYFTSPGTTTFAVPVGVRRVFVEVQGAGGAGGGTAAGSANGGGGGGGYVGGIYDITGTTSIQVFVGTGGTGAAGQGTSGTWSTFGTNGFYSSGAGGGVATTITSGAGGSGTSLVTALVIPGQSGSGSTGGTPVNFGGDGGGSQLGRGGNISNGTGAGFNASGYGGGGGGCYAPSGGCTGGNGSQGIVIVRW